MDHLGFDPSFISKSGNKTPVLGIQTLGKLQEGFGDWWVGRHRFTSTYRISFRGDSDAIILRRYDLVDYYAKLILDIATALTALSRILVVDGSFAKQNFVIPYVIKRT